MNDVFSKEKRSDIMSKIRSSNNASTELRLISVFKENNIKGWRRNYKIEGKPDFVFRKLKTAVFADGCFWHGHGCTKYKPKDNSDYWTAKLARNKKRDEEVNKILMQKGWKIIRIWECELKNKNREKLLLKLSPLLS